jgi:CBS domain-containing protein
MKVKEIMTRGCECIAPQSTLQQAAQRMKALDVGPLPVCEKDRLVGMLTDRDIVLRAVAEGRDPKATQVRDVMTPNVTYVFEDQDVAEAAQLMKEKQIRRLVVLNRDKRLVGMLSLSDIAVDTHDERLTGATLERISEPAKPRRVPVGAS